MLWGILNQSSEHIGAAIALEKQAFFAVSKNGSVYSIRSGLVDVHGPSLLGLFAGRKCS